MASNDPTLRRAQHQQQQSPQKRRQPPMNTGSSNEGGGRRGRDYGRDRDTVYDWEREWRDSVNKNLRELTEHSQQTALIVERMLARLAELEKRPSEARALFGVANQSLGSLIGFGALVVAVLSTLLQHVTFH